MNTHETKPKINKWIKERFKSNTLGLKQPLSNEDKEFYLNLSIEEYGYYKSGELSE